MKAILDICPVGYQRHSLHTRDREWAESNCYIDVWIELLHAWGFDPEAALPFSLAVDFDGDQWTFVKFPLIDLLELYGLDVQELAIWRPVLNHTEDQVGLGRPVLIEVDSFYLPDTVGMSYRTEHVKTTIAVVGVDSTVRQLRYFHGQGYFELSGEDFAGLFGLSESADPSRLPPYVEFVRRRPGPAPAGPDLTRASCRALRRQLDLLPTSNPFVRYQQRLESELDWLANASLDTFHKYSFVTLRQFGAAYELAAMYLRWLAVRTSHPIEAVAAQFDSLSAGAKTLQFHLARAMARRKRLDMTLLAELAAVWERSMCALTAAGL